MFGLLDHLLGNRLLVLFFNGLSNDLRLNDLGRARRVYIGKRNRAVLDGNAGVYLLLLVLPLAPEQLEQGMASGEGEYGLILAPRT
jgi:hypothetical protein